MFEITSAHLKVFSNVCGNMVVFWVAAILATTDQYNLTVDFIFAILSWYLAVRSEELLEVRYD